MTNDILQSDIDLARKLLDASRSSDEIVAALSYRGVNAERAAQLIAGLQAGKTVEADRPIRIRLQSAKTQETAPFAEKQGQKSAQADLSGERREPQPRRRKVNRFRWFTVLALAAACVCVAVFVLLNRKAHSNVLAEQRGSSGSEKTAGFVRSTGASGQGFEATAISVEVEADGLRLCGNPIARENFLPTIFKILGAPTRTNEMEKAEVIYAYDACGLLVYAPRDAGHCSIVLDFDGSDGAAGTKTAFVGTCKINKQDVRANTQAASLGAIKELGLEPPKSDSGIFHAHCGSVDLLFGYLKNPGRLNLIEIDFK
jgi:hypothetical protein